MAPLGRASDAILSTWSYAYYASPPALSSIAEDPKCRGTGLGTVIPGWRACARSCVAAGLHFSQHSYLVDTQARAS